MEMNKKEKSFLNKLILVCIVCFIIGILSMVISLDYLVNRSGIDLDFVKPEAYIDYQG